MPTGFFLAKLDIYGIYAVTRGLLIKKLRLIKSKLFVMTIFVFGEFKKVHQFTWPGG